MNITFIYCMRLNNLCVSIYQSPFSSFLSPYLKCLLTRLKSVIDFTSLISSLYYEEISPLHLGPTLSSFFLSALEYTNPSQWGLY